MKGKVCKTPEYKVIISSQTVLVSSSENQNQ